MAETVAQLEAARLKYEESVSAVSDAMRHCANMADQFALALHKTSLAPNGALLNGLDEENDSKRKRASKKKDKDPNAPKRPPSSYLLFQNSMRAEIKAKNPNATHPECMALITKLWADMPKEEKETWIRIADKAKAKYSSDKAAYDARSPEEVAAADAATAAAAIAAIEQKAAAKKARKSGKAEVPALKAPESATSEDDEDAEVSSDEEDQPAPPPAKASKAKAAVTPVAKPSSKRAPPPPAVESSEEDSDDSSDDDDEPPPPKKSKVAEPETKKRKGKK